MKLLIVDDEVITTQVLEEKLDRNFLGLEEVYVAYSVAMAVGILKREKVEIILCDVEMPGASGLELLKWIRDERKEVEFLFLTSHEKFEYIFDAMEQGVSNYLLKPVDISRVQQALLKTIEKIKRQRQIEEVQEYWSYGKHRILRSFWRNILFGDIFGEENIRKEIERQGLEKTVGGDYTLVLFLFRKENICGEEESQSLNQFIIDNVLAETLTEKFEMSNCVHWVEYDRYCVAVVADKEKEDIKKQMSGIKIALEQYFERPVQAVYVSGKGRIRDLGKYRSELAAYAAAHIHEEGEVLFIDEEEKKQGRTAGTLDQKFVFQCFEKGERVKLLEYLQKNITRIREKDCGRIYLEYFQMDLLQVAGAYLHKHDISAEFLFADAGYKKIWEKSRASVFFMIQWSAYYVNKIFDTIREREKGKNVVDTMVDYIHEHYEENINRGILAEKVNLSSEYVGKIFKKKIGTGINEYINMLRVEKAKNLLETTDYKVIDIALMVGYDNMPYFSCVFKKYVGISPAEYKKQ